MPVGDPTPLTSGVPAQSPGMDSASISRPRLALAAGCLALLVLAAGMIVPRGGTQPAEHGATPAASAVPVSIVEPEPVDLTLPTGTPDAILAFRPWSLPRAGGATWISASDALGASGEPFVLPSGPDPDAQTWVPARRVASDAGERYEILAGVRARSFVSASDPDITVISASLPDPVFTYRLLVIICPLTAASPLLDPTEGAGAARMTQANLDNAVSALREFPGLVRAWSGGSLAVSVTAVTSNVPLRHLSVVRDSLGPAPDDGAPVFAASGFDLSAYDGLMLIWARPPSVEGEVTAYAYGARDVVGNKSFATIPMIPGHGNLTGDYHAEELMHEWLHELGVYVDQHEIAPAIDLHASAGFPAVVESWEPWYRHVLSLYVAILAAR